MKRLLGLVGASLGGAIGWWLGARGGVMTAFFLSMVGTGIGMYLGRLVAERLLD